MGANDLGRPSIVNQNRQITVIRANRAVRRTGRHATSSTRTRARATDHIVGRAVFVVVDAVTGLRPQVFTATDWVAAVGAERVAVVAIDCCAHARACVALVCSGAGVAIIARLGVTRAGTAAVLYTHPLLAGFAHVVTAGCIADALGTVLTGGIGNVAAPLTEVDAPSVGQPTSVRCRRPIDADWQGWKLRKRHSVDHRTAVLAPNQTAELTNPG